MSLLNYTTKITPEQTIGEIQEMLRDYNVSGFLTEYEGRQVKSVTFSIDLNSQRIGFRMPCNWRGVYEILKNDPKCSRNLRTEEQAIRVAWRIIHTWIKGQLAMVEVNMVTIPQVFLPYAVMRDGNTLSEHVVSNPQFLLGGNSTSV